MTTAPSSPPPPPLCPRPGSPRSPRTSTGSCPRTCARSTLLPAGRCARCSGCWPRSSAEIDAELDAYYDALFVETADPASLRYLAALVGAIPLQPLPAGAPFDERAYIANTVRYRRGKGTARVLEALAADVTGCGAVAVEYFLRVARLQHLLDVRPERPATGLLVDGDTGARAGSAFDRLPRLLDVREVAPPHGRPAGRHGIPSVGVHLLRPVVPVFPAPPGDAVPAAATWRASRRHGRGPTARPSGRVSSSSRPSRVRRCGSSPPTGSPTPPAAVRQGRDLADRLRRLPLHRETDELRARAVEGRVPRRDGSPVVRRRAAQPFRVFVRSTGATAFTAVPPEQLRIANLEDAPAGSTTGRRSPYVWWAPGSTAPVTRHDGTAADHLRGRPGHRRVVVAARLRTGQPGGGGGAGRLRDRRTVGRSAPGAQERGRRRAAVRDPRRRPGDDLVWVVDPTAAAAGSAETGEPDRVRRWPRRWPRWPRPATGRRSFVHPGPLRRRGCGVGLDHDRRLRRRGVRGAPGRRRVAAPRVAPRHSGRPGAPRLRRTPRAAVHRRRARSASSVASGHRPRATPGRLVVDGLELTGGLRLAVRSVQRLDLRHTTLRSPGRRPRSPPPATSRPSDRGDPELDLRTGPSRDCGRPTVHRRPDHLRLRRGGRRARPATP